MDIGYFLRIIKKRIWLILLVMIIAAGVAYLISLRTPDRYMAQTSLTVIDKSEEVTGNEPVNENSPITSWNDLITSSQVLDLLSYRMILHDLGEDKPFVPVQLNLSQDIVRKAKTTYQAKLDSIIPLSTSIESDRIPLEILESQGYDAARLVSNITVKVSQDRRNIDLQYRSGNPELSSFAVNTLAEEFIRFYRYTGLESKINRTDYYAKLATEQKQRYLNTVTAQQDFVSIIKPNIPVAQGRELLIRKRFLDLMREESDRRVQVLEKAMIALNKMEVQNAESLSDTKTERINPAKFIQLTRKLISNLEQNKAYDAIRDSLRAEEETLCRQISSRAYAVGKSKSQTEKQNLLTIYENLQFESQAFIKDIERVLNKISNSLTANAQIVPEELKIMQPTYLAAYEQWFTVVTEADPGDSSLEIVVSSSSQVPPRPESVDPWSFMIMASLIAFALSVLTLWTVELMDVSLKTSGNFERVTGLKLLGNLNLLTAEKLDLVSLFGENASNKSLETYKHLMRKIRFEIMSMGVDIFLFTGANSGAGKSSLLLSLAYTLSLSHKKVLLVDTNFKNNQLTRMTTAIPTLERFVAGELNIDQIVSPTGLENVSIIGCEGGNYTPSEVFVPQETFTKHLYKLKENYDYIFLEGPELNTYADSRELVAFVEKVIPIFSADYSLRKVDRLSIRYLKSLGDKLGGAILNKVALEDVED